MLLFVTMLLLCLRNTEFTQLHDFPLSFLVQCSVDLLYFLPFAEKYPKDG